MTFKLFFMVLELEQLFKRKHNIVTDGMMTLLANNQVLHNM